MYRIKREKTGRPFIPKGANLQDFSFAEGSYQHSVEGTVGSVGLSAPIYCKDYGAWCKVKVTFKSAGGSPVGEPVFITIPHDANNDRLADHWQKQQVNAWNEQFRLGAIDPGWVNPEKPETWGIAFGVKTTPGEDADNLTETERNARDMELADSDGNGPMPVMLAPGDGLTALEEYRGFFLDGGPGTTTPRHRRLSVARKELLVECSEMDGIATVNTSPVPNAPDFVDQGNQANGFAQLYLLSTTMSKVSGVFAKEGQADGDFYSGMGIDLWWVRDSLDDGIANLVYEDGSVRSAYKYSGVYDWHPQQPENAKNGWVSLFFDETIEHQSEALYHKYYGHNTINGAGIMANNGNRNSLCKHFIKLVLSGRKGYRNSAGGVHSRIGEACREVDEGREPNYPNYQGSSVYINSLSEEGGLDNLAEFESRLAWGVAHELGHLFIHARGIQPFDAGENLDNDSSLMGRLQDVWSIRFHKQEIKHISLRNRASINKDQNEKIIP